MAKRRMLSLAVCDSDMFMDMPSSTQSLYFHLIIRADDDGFVSKVKRVMSMVGSGEDDYKILVGKKYIIEFDSGVIVIKHWLIHNMIRKDRYNPSLHDYEKTLINLKDSKEYTLNEGNPLVANRLPQVRLGKVRLGKVSLDYNIAYAKAEDVYNYYITLDLVAHRGFTNDMYESIISAINDLICDFEYLKTLLDRHKEKVQVSKGLDFEVKPRALAYFFSGKKNGSDQLICSDYDMEWSSPKREDFIKKNKSVKNIDSSSDGYTNEQIKELNRKKMEERHGNNS